MRTLFVAIVGAAMLALGAAVAGGAVTTTYHGTFSGTVDYQTCSGAPLPGTVSATGTWNVAVHRDSTATATFNIFTQESDSKRTHHVSYGLPVTLTRPGS